MYSLVELSEAYEQESNQVALAESTPSSLPIWLTPYGQKLLAEGGMVISVLFLIAIILHLATQFVKAVKSD